MKHERKFQGFVKVLNKAIEKHKLAKMDGWHIKKTNSNDMIHQDASSDTRVNVDDSLYVKFEKVNLDIKF